MVREARLQGKAGVAQARADSAVADSDLGSAASVIESSAPGLFQIDASGNVTISLSNGQTVTGNIPQLATMARGLAENRQEIVRLRQQAGVGFQKTKTALMAGKRHVDQIEQMIEEWGSRLETWVERFHQEAADTRDQGTAVFDVLAAGMNGLIDYINVSDVPTQPAFLGLARALEALTLAPPGGRAVISIPAIGAMVRPFGLIARLIAYSTPAGGLTDAFRPNTTTTTTTTLVGGVI